MPLRPSTGAAAAAAAAADGITGCGSLLRITPAHLSALIGRRYCLVRACEECGVGGPARRRTNHRAWRSFCLEAVIFFLLSSAENLIQ